MSGCALRWGEGRRAEAAERSPGRRKLLSSSPELTSYNVEKRDVAEATSEMAVLA